MSAANEEIDYRDQESDDRQLDVDLGDGKQDDNPEYLRKRVGSIGRSLLEKGLISKESGIFYSQIETGTEDAVVKVDAKMLKDVLTHAEKLERNGDRVYNRLTEAVQKGYASEKDREFLIEQIAHHPDFINQFQVAEKMILDKITRMEEDRKAYDKIADHKLVKNVGYLKVDANTKIAIPDEKAFLAMEVPDRRAFLKKVQDALPKAEKYAEKTGAEETKKLDKNYLELLDKALEKKIIGKKTHEKFIDGFKKIDKDEKTSWLREFPSQMARYEKLWSDIRGTLKGDALKRMESLRDEKGYTELFIEFGNTKESEKSRLDMDYNSKLNDFEKKGIIGRHTVNEFSNWMRGQDLKEKYKACELMHDGPGGQMEKYSKLHQDINKNLPKNAKEYLKSKEDEWGYTEMKAQYDRFIAGEKIPNDHDREKADPLARIESLRARAAIVEAEKMLEKKGGGKRELFLNRIKHMFTEERADSFNADDFQSKLKSDKKDIKPERIDMLKPGPDKDGVNDFQEALRRKRSTETGDKKERSASETEMEMKKFEMSGKARVVSEDGFKQVETKGQEGATKRKARVEINRERGIDRFLVEDVKHGYRMKSEGGKDEISIAFRTSDTSTVELKLNEIRVMEEYLEQKEEEARKTDKAA